MAPVPLGSSSAGWAWCGDRRAGRGVIRAEGLAALVSESGPAIPTSPPGPITSASDMGTPPSGVVVDNAGVGAGPLTPGVRRMTGPSLLVLLAVALVAP